MEQEETMTMIQLLFGPDSPLPDPAVELVLELSVEQILESGHGLYMITSQLFGVNHGIELGLYLKGGHFKPLYEYNYKYGLLDGWARIWHSNGQLKYEEFYVSGKSSGPQYWTFEGTKSRSL